MVVRKERRAGGRGLREGGRSEEDTVALLLRSDITVKGQGGDACYKPCQGELGESALRVGCSRWVSGKVEIVSGGETVSVVPEGWSDFEKLWCDVSVSLYTRRMSLSYTRSISLSSSPPCPAYTSRVRTPGSN